MINEYRKIIARDNGGPDFYLGSHQSYIVYRGEIYSFGLMFFGALGRYGNGVTPTKLDQLSEVFVEKMTIGLNNAFAITDMGEVYVWGYNNFGELGLGKATYSVNFPTLNNEISAYGEKTIKAGHYYTLLLDVKNNEVYSFGRNYYGQLGLSNFVDQYTPHKITYFDENNIEIDDIYVGTDYNFATTKDNKLYFWGRNSYAIGDPDIKDDCVPIPTLLSYSFNSPIKDIQMSKVSSGTSLLGATFILTEDGLLYSSGYNFRGQLGLGDNVNRNVPQLINVDGKLIDRIIVGYATAIAIAKDGSIYGWGDNLNGQLGLGYTNSQYFPVRLKSIEKINPIDIKIGDSHIMIKTKNGDIYGCGGNGFGQLGLGHTINASLPIKINISFPND